MSHIVGFFFWFSVFSFDAEIFRKVGVKVDISFETAESPDWFCAEVVKVSAVQVEVDFVNGDPSIRVKPTLKSIRSCIHDPQQQVASKLDLLVLVLELLVVIE